MGRICSVVLPALVAGAARPGPAQHAQAVAGVVQRDLGGTTSPVANVWVVLHRVASDSAAPVDSVRSDARGRYTVRRALQSDSAVFFTSAVYGGVAYFTPPFRGVDGPGEGGVITVYDTTSVGAGVRTRGRHVIVSVVDPSNQRAVVEVFEIENEGPRTRVATAHSPSWSTQLPASATDVHIEQGDVPPEAIAVRDGRVEVFAPIVPGLRQIVFSYSIHAASFPAMLPVPDTTSMLEVLLEDPGSRADGAGLIGEEPITLQGRTFERFVARDVPAGATFLIVTPPPGSRTGSVTIAVMVGLVGIVLLLAVARAALGSGGLATRTVADEAARSSAQEAQRLAKAIADLDARFERRANAGAGDRAAYEAERAALKDQLTAVLAERDESL